MEEWKPIPGYEGLYEVSNRGAVRSLDRIVIGRWGTPRRVRSRTLRIAKAKYVLATLSRDGVSKTFAVHRLVCEVFNGPPPSSNMHAAHKDGNPYNNVPENLYWATPSENCEDRKRHGTWVHGTRVNTNKLSERDVEQIASLCRSGVSRKDVAQQYGVHRSSVDQLMRGATWKHLEKASGG